MATTTDLEKKAKEAFVDDDFELSVNLYSQAIDVDPKNADLFADRAQANIKLHNFTEAVADANRAIQLDSSMAKAYLRKGTACLKLEEFQTAKTALISGAALAPGDARFFKLLKECEERIAEETSDLPNQSVSNTTEPADTLMETANPSSETDTVMETANTSSESEQINTLPEQPPVIAPAKPKYRHEFYQKPEEVVVTIFAKGVKAEHLVVDFGEQILSVTIEIPGEEEVYHFQPRLFGKIKPENCKYVVLSTKIEIRLAKVEPINWTSLEYVKEPLVLQKIKAPAEAGRPVYPSSKSKAVNWDKLEAQVKKEEKEEKLDGDAALNKFFRDIYKDADEDVRRAMSKSFVESNGTVLSTNWKEVGAKKVEGSPPDGMEMKKWEY
ncbi:Cochaperone protein [Ranunculus cassubicifolius]